nr:protein adenylyltransferase SelO family protein [Corynebacterium lactis]
MAGQDQPGRATQLYEVQAKGTGPTPFSRGGDGKATLTSALREYLISEAMFAQGIPTTRALAVIATGEQIHRGPQVPFDEQRPTSELQPGGIVVRVATSHLRVGTFELIARSGPDVMPRAISFAADRHLYDATARGVLQGVVTRQADLVAQWMTSGFVHGVMNTDNTTISGETIDYGPCAFLDAHDPRAVFSSIDHAGRYAFGAQPTIAGWNLTRLAEALLPSIADKIAAADADTDAAADTSPNTPDAPNAALDVAREILGGFADEFATALARHWLPKLGLPASLYDDPTATDLLRRWQSLLAQFGPDHTNAHLALGKALSSEDADALVASRATLDASEQWAEAAAGWVADWAAVREKLGIAPEESAALMEASNPAYVPRNHLVTETLAQAAEGNLDDYRQLLEAVTHPYEGRAHSDDDQTPRPEKFTLPAPAGLGAFRSYCGT